MSGAIDTFSLFRRFPQLAPALPRAVLTALPTPVHRLERLSTALSADVWIKRDDVSGPLYGGNKPRKLEFLLGHAQARGYKTVLTTGGIGTHHGLATAICAQSLGMKCVLVLLRQPLTESVRRSLLLDFAAGAEMHWAESVLQVAAIAIRRVAAGAARGDLPYIIQTGGTSRLGTIGYINAAFELAEQVASRQIPEPSHIFVPLGSGGTVAGLVAGLKLAGLRSRVVAVTVTDILPPSKRKLRRLGLSSVRFLRRADPSLPAVKIGLGDFDVIDGFVGDGYGHPTALGDQAMDQLRALEGMDLDQTYTAKALAGLTDAVARKAVGNGPILFWNTYSSVDPSRTLGPLPDYRSLPPAFHGFFR